MVRAALRPRRAAWEKEAAERLCWRCDAALSELVSLRAGATDITFAASCHLSPALPTAPPSGLATSEGEILSVQRAGAQVLELYLRNAVEEKLVLPSLVRICSELRLR